MQAEHSVTRNDMLELCDAALAGRLPADSLDAVAYVLLNSDRFHVTDAVDLEVLKCREDPETNCALTMDNVRRFRERLLGGGVPQL